MNILTILEYSPHLFILSKNSIELFILFYRDVETLEIHGHNNPVQKHAKESKQSRMDHQSWSSLGRLTPGMRIIKAAENIRQAVSTLGHVLLLLFKS